MESTIKSNACNVKTPKLSKADVLAEFGSVVRHLDGHSAAACLRFLEKAKALRRYSFYFEPTGFLTLVKNGYRGQDVDFTALKLYRTCDYFEGRGDISNTNFLVGVVDAARSLRADV